jgi:hypothetical protein
MRGWIDFFRGSIKIRVVDFPIHWEERDLIAMRCEKITVRL